jgi:hypothetical protein
MKELQVQLTIEVPPALGRRLESGRNEPVTWTIGPTEEFSGQGGGPQHHAVQTVRVRNWEIYESVVEDTEDEILDVLDDDILATVEAIFSQRMGWLALSTQVVEDRRRALRAALEHVLEK